MIIAISGKSNSGKDTIATMIADELYHIPDNKPVKLLSFAMSIKKICSILENTHIDNYIDTYEKNRYVEEFLMTRGEFMTSVGSAINSINKDIWINYTKNIIDKYSKDHHIIITDCRLINEYNYLKSQNIPIIKIHRPFVYRRSDIKQFIESRLYCYILHEDEAICYLQPIRFKNKEDKKKARQYYKELTDISETDLNNLSSSSFDFFINNDSTLGILSKYANIIVNKFNK